MATYRSLDRLRQRKPISSLDGLPVPGTMNGPEEDAIAGELQEQLRHAVTQLPQQEAAVFCLRYFEDLSYKQIAESLQVTSGAVATALHKARAKLEVLLGDCARGD